MEKDTALDLITSLSPEELAKAVKDGKGLEGIRIIKDLWEDYYHIPDRNDTKTGPAMHSAGSGVDKAMAEYSNPAPQVGITEQYKELTTQNLEGWGKMHSAFKSFGDELKETLKGTLEELNKSLSNLSKAEEKDEKKEDKHEMKADEPKEEEKMNKSVSSEKIASMWEELGNVELAFAKADDDEKKDVEGLESARRHIEKAEKELEAVESHEKEEMAHKAVTKAEVFINLAWSSLAKATGLNRYDLHGYGNQSDEVIHGDENSDRANKDYKAAKAKADFYSLKVKTIEKSLGIKSEEPKKASAAAPAVEKAAEPKEKEDDAKYKSDLENLQSELTKTREALETANLRNAEFNKASSDRIAQLNSRLESVAGHPMPPMTQFVFKSGATQEAANHIRARIESAEDSGYLSEDHAGIARNLVTRFEAVKKGKIAGDIVNQQLDKAPLEVRNFFSSLEQTV